MRNLYLYAITIVALLSSFPQKAHATHGVGGEITYSFVDTNQFLVSYIFYKDCNPNTAGEPQQVDILWSSASCNVSGSVNGVGQDPGTGQPVQTGIFPPCGVTTCDGGTGYGVRKFTYTTLVVLPQACNDYIFTVESFGATFCCRNNIITTLTNPGGEGIYTEAFLNNLDAPVNSSPVFSRSPIATFCINRNFILPQPATDVDGDSLVFSLTDCLSDQGTPVVYNAPYSGTNPFNSTPPVAIDATNGNISFNNSLLENGVMAVLVQEYRNSILIGSTVRDMQIQFEQVCNDPPVLDTTTAEFYISQIQCTDTLVKIKTNFKFLCSTLDADGSDFRLITPSGLSIPISAAILGNCANQESDSLILSLFAPLLENGTYTLYSKKGFSGNTLINKCGLELAEFDSVSFNFRGCYPGIPNLLNVTVTQNNEDIDVLWAIPDSLPIPQFARYEVYRSALPTGPYNYLVGTTTTYTDTTIRDVNVDPELEPYNYAVKCVLQNGFITPQSDSIQSILLTCEPNADSLTINFRWTRYWGWTGTGYTVYQADSLFNWAPLAGSFTLDTNYLYTRPLASGTYYVRVQTENGSTPNLTSISNWCKVIAAREKVVLFNVFTPGNGDNLNNVFTVKNIDSYPGSTLKVFNRWGKVVFEDANYNNTWNGDDLADGTYYYTLEVNGNTIEKYNGTVTILRNK
ncbi:MAG: hypothetical protein RIQ89_203 [Bacteroidota bacterium]|jgi:gliding motility-associated-like protein